MSGPDQAQRERERLSALLRDMRAHAGFTSSDSARKAGFSQSKLSKVENGLLLPSEADVRSLCRVYQATVPQRREVLGLVQRLQNEVDSARVILKRGAYRKQQEIGRIEADATLLRDFQPAYVLGLLQTRDYIRRIFTGMSDDEVDRAIDARLTRQQALNDRSKQFNLIMSEGALLWRALPRESMIAQLDHIAEVAKRPNVRVGIVAHTTEVSVFPGHAFHIYDDRLVIVGTVAATATIRDPRDIALYVEMFDSLEAAASYGDEADEVFRRVRAQYVRLT